jgi:chemotaxis protein methyltransferase CheR
VIPSSELNYVRILAKEKAAIVIESAKDYLIESRLEPVARREGFASTQDFIRSMRENKGPLRLHDATIDALTTNETLFFRDHHPFDALRQTLLPELIATRARYKKLRIWSAACSTGQEPYSIAMLLADKFPELDTWDVRIIATDLSDTVLEQARSGNFSKFEINRGLPAPMLVKFFEQHEQRWVIRESLRKKIEFRKLNLAEEFPILPQFDLVFLRNVMIYFDLKTKQQILTNVRKVLAPDGYLALGSSETPLTITGDLKSIPVGRTAFYQYID